MTDATFLSRQERFAQVGSTNDVVRDWLAAGTSEVCLALADEQTAGRGRDGRTWVGRPGSAMLLSLGFRPTWLAPKHVWRLPALVSLAMADAAEEVAGLADQAIRLKWPNDLVIEDAGAAGSRSAAAAPGAESTTDRPDAIRKLAGVLGETTGLGTSDPTAVVGIGINADWPRAEFPADLAGTMTSLRDASGGRPVDLGALLDAFLSRLEPRVLALRGGRFPVSDWIDRQLTTGRLVDLARPDGSIEQVQAIGVDVDSGGIVVADVSAPLGERTVTVGEIVRLRIAVGV